MRILLLTGVLFGTLLGAPPASAAFTDIPEDHPYAAAIDFLVKEGIARGYDAPPDALASGRTFRPDIAISRAEFTKIVTGSVFSDTTIDQCLTKLAVKSEILEYIDFSDVDYTSWYGPSLCIAVLSDIIQGYADRTFRPEDSVNFAEAAKILVSSFQIESPARHDPDLPPGIWYKPYVEDLADLEAIPPTVRGLEYPITRGEMAEMIYRIMNKNKVPFGWSLSYNDLVETVPRTAYVDRENGFGLTYPSNWPEPGMQPRGVTRDGIPASPSSWRLYIGPAPTNCFGHGECIERDLYLDGYEEVDVEQTVQQLHDSDDVTVIEDAFDGTRWLIIYDERTESVIDVEQWNILMRGKAACLSRRALVITEGPVFRLTSRCANGDETQVLLFEDLLQSFSLVRRVR